MIRHRHCRQRHQTHYHPCSGGTSLTIANEEAPTPASPTNDDNASNYSHSSAVWDPNNTNNSCSDAGDEDNSRKYASQFPSQIDVSISSAANNPGGGNRKDATTCGNDHSNEKMMDALFRSSSSESDDDNNNIHRPRLERRRRIRYEMLGAPALLYRHAPSYLSPENRPSTLSPQQLFMALYAKDRPATHWFVGPRANRPSPKQCPFLSSTNVPCPPRPWGCAATTTTTLSSSSPQSPSSNHSWKEMTEEDKSRYQQMAKDHNEKEEVVNADDDDDTETGSRQPKRFKKNPATRKNTAISALNVYRTELNVKCTEEGRRPPPKTEVASRWKELTEEDKSRYQQMADERNGMEVINERNDVDAISDLSNSQAVPNEVGGPGGYGNCLITIPCQCRRCDQRQPCWFLVHPTGDNLSHVSISKVSLPRGPSHRNDQNASNAVDVGRRILQISQCGPRLKSTDGTICLVARTSHYCSVIYACTTEFMTTTEQEECGTNYELREKARIDMSRPLQSPHHLPVFVACDPKTTVSHFTCPSIAILSRDNPTECTTIHRVLIRDEPIVHVHSLSASLADISLLEFCSDDRMSLWAAARSTVMPKLALGFFKKKSGTLAGYGHSLYRIDLRNNSASLFWSPSHAEYLTEGLHSINGIITDANNEHLIWVSSTSACKIWALDVIYKPARVVASWSLSFLCDDLGPQFPVSGIFGRGVIFSQPTALRSSSMNDRDVESSPVMFSVKKDPNTSVLGVHQLPSQMPRFQAKVMESAGFQESSNSSVARSAVFPLPDVTGTLFYIGVITMTSLGDMYCHSLLATNAEEKSAAKSYPGLPVGTKAIPYPGKLNAKPEHLRITLCNRFPIPSSAITPHVILKSEDCCPFKSYEIRDILNREPMPDIRLSEQDDSAERTSECKGVPRSMYDISDSNAACESFEFNESCKTFRVAYHAANDGDPNEVHHSFPRFGMVLSKSGHRISSQCRVNIQNGGYHRSIALDSSHVIVATCAEKEDGGYDSIIDSPKEKLGHRPNEDLDLDIVDALQSSYYCKDNVDDFDVGVVKNESSSSDSE